MEKKDYIKPKAILVDLEGETLLAGSDLYPPIIGVEQGIDQAGEHGDSKYNSWDAWE